MVYKFVKIYKYTYLQKDYYSLFRHMLPNYIIHVPSFHRRKYINFLHIPYPAVLAGVLMESFQYEYCNLIKEIHVMATLTL